MPTPYETVKYEVDALIKDYKERLEDGRLDFKDVFSLLMNGAFGIARILQKYSDLEFAERKAFGVELVEQFYNEVIVPIDLPIPDFIEGYVDDTVGLAIKPLIESLYDAIDEFVYNKFD